MMKHTLLILTCAIGLWAQASDSVMISENGRVINKPYSAAQVIHTVQTLADGSHIDRTTTNLVYQDAQGRFRMETTDSRHLVVVQDKVGLVVYNLDLEHKTARKTDMFPAAAAAAQRIAGDVSPVEEARQMAARNPNNAVEELGAQIVNGVSAVGVRVTTIIPVGGIGNDRELKSVSERWYSNDIHAMVKSTTTDPRTGTTTYELTNIVRSAPDPLLFQVPPGFTVTGR